MEREQSLSLHFCLPAWLLVLGWSGERENCDKPSRNTANSLSLSPLLTRMSVVLLIRIKHSAQQ